MSSDHHKYANLFAFDLMQHSGPGFLADPTLFRRLTLATQGKLSVVWAPFDHVESDAKLAIVGITPGRTQAENALREFRERLLAGATMPEALSAAKRMASFSGPMRNSLTAMLDHVGLNSALGLTSTADLFAGSGEGVHLTSALRYPLFLGTENYNGTPDMIRTAALRSILEN